VNPPPIPSSAAAPPASVGYPTPRANTWLVPEFRFHTGETLRDCRLHYHTVGDPAGEPVLILHGTVGAGEGFLTPRFAGALFGPGQALDASRYFLILPDSIGGGKSSKPSDGLRMRFPRFNYDDAVLAQYRLLTEHLGVRHLRMVIGNSMGGMQVWLWAQQYPDFMDIAVPMASLPTAMSGRNWMMRRMIIDAIRNDPDWKQGEYTQQPRAVHVASVFFGIATNGGNIGLQRAAPTRAQADAYLDKLLSAPFAGDANDLLYRWESSRDYDPEPALDRIEARLLAVNSADDERNPIELGVLQKAIERIPDAKLLIIPASEETAGHGTTGQAKFWKREVAELLETAPHRG